MDLRKRKANVPVPGWMWGLMAALTVAHGALADAPVINLDFGPNPGTHGAVAGVGPLGGGPVWNLVAGTLANLDDSFGNPTGVNIVVTNGSPGERGTAPSNALQDDYLTDDPEVTFVIGGLDPTKSYTLAFFAHATFAHQVTVTGNFAVAYVPGLDWQGNAFNAMVEGSDFVVAGSGFTPKSGSNTIEVVVKRQGVAGTAFVAGLQIAEDFTKADGLIGARRNRLGGNDIYKRRGSGPQKVRKVLHRPQAVKNFIEVQNDGLATENFSVRQVASSRVNRREFRVKYFQLPPGSGRVNITGGIRRGSFSPMLTGRERNPVLILQKIKPKRSALRSKRRITAKIDIECDPDNNDSVADEDNLRSIVVVKRR